MSRICGTDPETFPRGKDAFPFFVQTVAALSPFFQIERVLCDSGFYRIDFINHLESESFPYILAVPITPTIQRELARISSWDNVDEGLEAGEFYFEHRDEKWERARRYIAIRQQVETRPQATGKSGEQMTLFEEYEELGHYRFSVLITSETDLSPVKVWRAYRSRANDENVIKDLKEGLGFGAFNVHGFWATEAILVTTALVCHNLLHFLDTQLLNRGTAKRQAKTLRNTWFILPGQLGNSGGRYSLRIAVKAQALRAKIVRTLNEILRLPYRLNGNAVGPP